MPVTGDFGGLKKLKLTFAQLPKVSKLAALGAAPELRAKVQAQFAASADAYGNPWKPLSPATIRRHGAHAPMALTGALRGAVTATPGPHFVKFALPSRANFVTGARPVFPKLSLPPGWQIIVRKHCEQALQIVTGGGR